MKNLLIKYSLLLFSLIVIVFSSCYEESDWLGDNTTTEGKHYPVIATLRYVDADTYYFGETAGLDLRYWSDDPIQSIKLFEQCGDVDAEAFSTGYQEAFSDESQTDSLILNYTPHELSCTNPVTLKVEITNENGLSKSKSKDFTFCDGASLAGDYTAATVATDSAGVALDFSATVSITEQPGDDEYAVSDISGGLYTDQYGVGGVLAGFTRNKCGFSVDAAHNEFGQTISFTATASMHPNGTIVIEWSSDQGEAGESGVTTLTRQ